MNILLVDDHVIFRDGIKYILQSDPRLTITGEAGNGRDALELHKELKPDLIIMDADMPIMNGIEAAKEIRKTDKEVKIIILNLFEKESFLYDGISAGINGYIIKMPDMKLLLQAVYSISWGLDVYSPAILHNLIRHSALKQHGQKANNKHENILSKREKEIVRLVAAGQSNQQIAENLFLSIYTVKNHRKNIMRKLGFKKSTELIRFALEMGYTK